MPSSGSAGLVSRTMTTSFKYNLEGKMDNFIIGIIGMGDMGKMYARRLSDAGWR